MNERCDFHSWLEQQVFSLLPALVSQMFAERRPLTVGERAVLLRAVLNVIETGGILALAEALITAVEAAEEGGMYYALVTALTAH